ncbi:MAG: FkbM family methyltransferase [Pyrinomonadaceae bacterium]
MDRREQIHLRTLSSFCEEQQIGHVDLLKLDVEGHELKVLEGARDLIGSRAINYIQFEFGGTDIDSRTFFRDFFYLLDPQYKLFRILRDGLAPIEACRESLELFGYVNYLAISRKESRGVSG